MWKSQLILLRHKNLLTCLLAYKGSVNLKLKDDLVLELLHYRY